MDSGRCRGKRSSRRKVGPAFEFIDFAGSLSTVEPRTKEARIIIRRQAARSGRRKHSRESASRSQEDCTSVTPKVKDSAREKFNVPPRAQYARPVMRLAINGYETMRAVYNFDITTLDSFVNVDLAINAFRSLQDQPTSPVALLQKSSSSFLAYLPSRYGFTPFLNDAMHCVAAKAAQMLGHSSTQTSPSELHFKAIRSLYSAKQNDAACSKADIYCATRLLVLYESLGSPNVNALAIHNEYGIKHLSQEGPSPDLSHFDCMLFRSQGPHILISEMYRKESSMFEAPEWQDFFDRAADKETGVDSHYWWKLFGCMTFLPGILKDARALFSETTLDPFMYSSRSCDILKRAKNMYQVLNDNHILYQRSPLQPRSLVDPPSSVNVESTDRIRLQGFLLYPAMFIFRLQATLSLGEVDRAMGEEEAQKVAAQTLLVEKMARNSDPTMAWHLRQRNSLPYSIIRTREEWLPINERGRNWEELRTFLARRWLLWEEAWNDTVLVQELEVEH